MVTTPGIQNCFFVSLHFYNLEEILLVPLILEIVCIVVLGGEPAEDTTILLIVGGLLKVQLRDSLVHRLEFRRHLFDQSSEACLLLDPNFTEPSCLIWVLFMFPREGSNEEVSED